MTGVTIKLYGEAVALYAQPRQLIVRSSIKPPRLRRRRRGLNGLTGALVHHRSQLSFGLIQPLTHPGIGSPHALGPPGSSASTRARVWSRSACSCCCSARTANDSARSRA